MPEVRRVIRVKRREESAQSAAGDQVTIKEGFGEDCAVGVRVGG